MTAPSLTVEQQVVHELLLRCAAHDEAALAHFYRLTSPCLHAVVRRRLRAERDIEAILVTTYVNVWRQAGSYAASSGESAWAWTLLIMEQALAQLTFRDRSRAWVSSE